MPSHSFPALPHGAIPTFHINFCFFPPDTSCQTPAPAFLIAPGAGSRAGTAQPQRAPASPPRLALPQEHQELQNQHSACYTMGQSPVLNWYFFNSATATSKQVQSLCRCPSCSSSPPRMCISDPLAPLINLVLPISLATNLSQLNIQVFLVPPLEGFKWLLLK